MPRQVESGEPVLQSYGSSGLRCECTLPEATWVTSTGLCNTLQPGVIACAVQRDIWLLVPSFRWHAAAAIGWAFRSFVTRQSLSVRMPLGCVNRTLECVKVRPCLEIRVPDGTVAIFGPTSLAWKVLSKPPRADPCLSPAWSLEKMPQ